MDGYEVAKRLRELFLGSPPFLISLSGYENENDRRRARDAGFNEQFVKPVNLSALRTVLAGRAEQGRITGTR